MKSQVVFLTNSLIVHFSTLTRTLQKFDGSQTLLVSVLLTTVDYRVNISRTTWLRVLYEIDEMFQHLSVSLNRIYPTKLLNKFWNKSSLMHNVLLGKSQIDSIQSDSDDFSIDNQRFTYLLCSSVISM